MQGDKRIRATYVVFDVLEHDGEATMRLPYRERRQLLESPKLTAPARSTAPVYGDGPLPFEQVCERGLEGIVAKRLDQPYRPGNNGGRRLRTETTGPTRPSWRLLSGAGGSSEPPNRRRAYFLGAAVRRAYLSCPQRAPGASRLSGLDGDYRREILMVPKRAGPKP